MGKQRKGMLPASPVSVEAVERDHALAQLGERAPEVQALLDRARVFADFGPPAERAERVKRYLGARRPGRGRYHREADPTPWLNRARGMLMEAYREAKGHGPALRRRLEGWAKAERDLFGRVKDPTWLPSLPPWNAILRLDLERIATTHRAPGTFADDVLAEVGGDRDDPDAKNGPRLKKRRQRAARRAFDEANVLVVLLGGYPVGPSQNVFAALVLQMAHALTVMLHDPTASRKQKRALRTAWATLRSAPSLRLLMKAPPPLNGSTRQPV